MGKVKNAVLWGIDPIGMAYYKLSAKKINNEEPRINSMKYQQSTYGATKTVIYGTQMLCGNVIDSVDLVPTAHKQQGRQGKGRSTVTTDTHTLIKTGLLLDFVMELLKAFIKFLTIKKPLIWQKKDLVYLTVHLIKPHGAKW